MDILLNSNDKLPIKDIRQLPDQHRPYAGTLKLKGNNSHCLSDSAGAQIALGHISIDLSNMDKRLPQYDDLLILPTRNLVLFPGVHQSLRLGRDASVRLAEYAERSKTPIGVFCQRDESVENPAVGDLFGVGVVAHVVKVLELPDGQKTALLFARNKIRIADESAAALLPGSLAARVVPVPESVPRRNNRQFSMTVRTINDMLKNILQKTYEGPVPPFSFADENDSVNVINTICTNVPMDLDARIGLLETDDLKERARRLLAVLTQQNEEIDISQEIMQRARSGMEENQRSAFLHEQMNAIRQELYGNPGDEVDALQSKLDALPLDESSRQTLNREIEKIRRLSPSSPDYAVQYQYLTTVLDLPWGQFTPDNTDFAKAEKLLDESHFGLEKVKERVLEQLAVIINCNETGRTPILCLVGPPGVGKTSLGQAVADALGRKYQRVSFGGLHDEAEIRGHRRTYIGAMPGRIIDAIKRAGTSNPVIVLDEIDKIGKDYKGDPGAALLEVLDPEQNKRFHDNYIDIDFDLSQVLFIATANTLETVSRPLLDRIEVIEIPGYVQQEKTEIAKRHIIPKLLKNYAPINIRFGKGTIESIIESYTAESGVRMLEKKLGAIFRKATLLKMRGQNLEKSIKPGQLTHLLGTPPIRTDHAPAKMTPGVSLGMAWTQVGGAILMVEAASIPSKSGGKLTLTGNLGDVMKESATIALQWVKANAKRLSIEPEVFDTHDIHIHVPEGAVPKDGPSAGITMVTAIVSALTGISVRPLLAMTGETTLRGQVLPVGGIREKILAAKRAGVTKIVLCDDNRRDIDEIAADYLDGLDIEYVTTVDQVLEAALDGFENNRKTAS